MTQTTRDEMLMCDLIAICESDHQEIDYLINSAVRTYAKRVSTSRSMTARIEGSGKVYKWARRVLLTLAADLRHMTEQAMHVTPTGIVCNQLCPNEAMSLLAHMYLYQIKTGAIYPPAHIVPSHP
jgi:hypothetical protein